MSLNKLAVIGALALVSTSIQAQSTDNSAYGEIAITSAKYSIQSVSGSWNPNAIRGLFGKGVHQYAAVEALLLVGMSDSTNQNVKLSMTNGAGIYIKPRYKIGESAEVFARLGWANINTKVGTSDSADDGESYGAGVSLNINKAINLNADYMVYNKAGNSMIDGVSIGLAYKF